MRVGGLQDDLVRGELLQALEDEDVRAVAGGVQLQVVQTRRLAHFPGEREREKKMIKPLLIWSGTRALSKNDKYYDYYC